ncbi:MAG: threonyl-tRNA synthetase [Anaerocolumna sp.]|jgi:hypothetical protein|nr:threonyl-tRNA synthetase [Anaerocolumna sp.]
MSDKKLDLSKTVYELCTNDPAIISILIEAGFRDIANPIMMKTAGKVMTIPKGAMMKKINLEDAKQLFRNYGYEV